MRRRKLFVALALALVATAIAVPAYATHSSAGGVSATVTPAFLSVTVTEQHVEYGTLDLGVTGQLPTEQTGDEAADAAFVVTNNGTKTATWTITGAATVSGDWTIAASAGNNIYAHRYGTSASSGAPAGATELEGAPTELGTGIAANGTVAVWLELDMPTECDPGVSTCDIQTLPITITASVTPP